MAERQPPFKKKGEKKGKKVSGVRRRAMSDKGFRVIRSPESIITAHYQTKNVTPNLSMRIHGQFFPRHDLIGGRFFSVIYFDGGLNEKKMTNQTRWD